MRFLKLHVSPFLRAGLCFLLVTCPHLIFAQSDAETRVAASSDRGIVLSSNPDSLDKDKAAELRTKRIQATTSFTQGQLLEADGKKEEALACYEKASQADPDFLPSSIRKAYILIQLDKCPDALTILQKILPKDPQNAEILGLISFAYLRDDHREDAKKWMDQAYQATINDPSREPEYYDRVGEMLGKLMVDLENATPTDYAKKLLPIFEKAAEENTRNIALLARIAEMHFLLSEHKQALEYYEKIYDLAPRFPQIREKLVLTLLAVGNESRAIEIIEEILQKDPTLKKYYPILGELYERAKKWDKSEENYLLSIRLGNNTAQDYTLAALSLLRNKKPSESVTLLQEALLKYPESPHLYYLKGIALRSNKQFKESVESFDQAEKKGQFLENFLTSSFYFEYGSSCEQAHDYAVAEQMFQKALEKDPKNHIAMNYMAYMWAEQNRKLNEAEKLLKKALELDPNNPAYQDSLGWTYYQMGNMENAQKYLSLSLKQMGDDPVVNDHMGDVLFKQGNIVKALEYWNKALPKSDERARIEAKIRKGQEDMAMKTPSKR